MNESYPITVLKELEEFILPPTKEELVVLEQSIIKEGCRDCLVIWQRPDGTNILVDGHNRLKICLKHGLPYAVRRLSFDSIDDAKDWMVDNQLGRRNLSPDQLSYYRGVKYLSARRAKGGYKNIQSKGQNDLSTADVLAEQFKVSSSTIKRDAKFAAGVDIIAKSNPQLKLQILSGLTSVKKADIQILTEHKDPAKLTIKNEADLHNKARQLREEIIDDVERKVKDIYNKKISEAQATLLESDPVFLKREDRLRKIKGMIVSSINKAISERDVAAIKVLKNLIESLEREISSNE